MWTPEQQEGWERDGFFRVPGFASRHQVEAMEARVVEMARAQAGGEPIGDAYVLPEEALEAGATQPEEKLSKLFRVHRQEPIFRRFACDPAVLDRVRPILGPDLDCFLSQFIFKLPGALGQPWHQDAFYFPFDRGPQVGVWLAVTEARMDNGPLWVLPGSHRQPVHGVVRDRREHAHFSYVEIVDHDMSGAVPVLLEPGDALFFHSHLMHKSTDNGSDTRRAAMVYHYAEGGTVDQSQEKWGFTPPNVDWMPVRRRIETSIEISAPVERVRAVLLDGPRYADWNPYLVRIEGAIESGAGILAHGRTEDGDVLEMPVQVVSVGPGGMHWEGGLPDRDQFRGDHRFAWEADGPGRSVLHHTEDFTGALVGEIIAPRLDDVRANFERMNEGLRRHCETA